MILIGKIVDPPNQISAYATVRDEHLQEYTVHASEIPYDAETDDEYPYYVDLWHNESGTVATLRYDDFDT